MKKEYKILIIILLVIVLAGIGVYEFNNKKPKANDTKKETVSANSRNTTKSSDNKQYLTGNIVSVSDSELILNQKGKQKIYKMSKEFPPLVVKKGEKHIEIKGNQGTNERIKMLKPGITVTVHLGPNVEEINKKIKEEIGSPNSLSAEEYSNKLKNIQSKLYSNAEKDFVDYVIID